MHNPSKTGGPSGPEIAHLNKTDDDTVKPVLNGHSKIDKTKILTKKLTNGSLMKVEFQPSSSDNRS